MSQSLLDLATTGCACPSDSDQHLALLDAPVAVAPAAPAPAEAVPATTPSSTSIPWSGTLGMEGEATGDGRYIEPGALRWDEGPLPLRYVSSDVGAHDGAVVVGRIDEIWRGEATAEGVPIEGRGIIDLRTKHGLEAARQIGTRAQPGLTNGVSMDLDDVSFEVRVAPELLDAEGQMEGLELAGDDGLVKVMEVGAGDEMRITTSGRVRAATIVAIAAFTRARIALDAEPPDEDTVPVVGTEELVASASTRTRTRTHFPVEPPEAWFANPNFKTVSPLTVTREGRIFGHLAQWAGCHIAHLAKTCVPPPRSNSGYAYFRVGSVLTSEDTLVPTGVITLDTRHALDGLTPARTLAHYEDTGLAVADVAAGEDAHGIWVSGSLRPNVTPEQVRALRASPLSGDWRRVGGSLELVAALCVNVPGFPLPRPSGLLHNGAVQSLVAAGMVPPRQVLPPEHPDSIGLDDLRWLKRLAQRERDEEAAKLRTTADNLAARTTAMELQLRVKKANRAFASFTATVESFTAKEI